MSKNDDLVRLRKAIAKLEIPSLYGVENVRDDLTEIADAIERGAAQGVRVKPMEWEVSPGDKSIGEPRTHYGFWVGGYYHAGRAVDGGPCSVGSFDERGLAYQIGCFASLKDAKAAAQADYERRILSALDLATPPAPAPDAGEPAIGALQKDEWEYVTVPAPQPSSMDARVDSMDASATPQPPAVEAEAVVTPIKRYILDEGRLCEAHDGPIVLQSDHEASLKAKTDEIERLRRERDKARAQALENGKALCRERNRAKAAEASNKEMREGLKFYADRQNYTNRHPYDGFIKRDDYGGRARALLSETGGE